MYAEYFYLSNRYIGCKLTGYTDKYRIRIYNFSLPTILATSRFHLE